MQSMGRSVDVNAHRHYMVVAAVDEQQQIPLKPCRASLEQIPTWAEGHLKATNQVALCHDR